MWRLRTLCDIGVPLVTMSTPTTEADWVSIATAAEQLGVHPRTLRRYIRDEKLSVLRLSPQVVRISQRDIDQFLQENIKVTTGTGNCYVPAPPEVKDVGLKAKAEVKPAKPAAAAFGRFG